MLQCMVAIRKSPSLNILSVKIDSKLTIEYHVHGIVSRVYLRIWILRMVNRVFVDTLCYFVDIMYLFSNPWVLLHRGSAAECHLQLSSARHIRWTDFTLIRVSCRCVIDVMLFCYVCCRRLIQTLITVYSVSLLMLYFNCIKI